MRLDELTERDARAIARWRYPPPYDCYDYPSWGRMTRELWAICDEELRRDQFRSVLVDPADRVDGADGFEARPAGYVRFRPADGSLALHLGLRPDLCGRGLGAGFLDLVVDEALRRARGGPVTLEVRRFNTRAAAAYRRAAFRFVDTDDPAGVGPQDLLPMVLDR